MPRCSAGCKLDPLLRELAILRVARLTPHAEYEWVQHVPIAQAVGSQRAAGGGARARRARGELLLTGPANGVAFTTEVVRDARASEEALAALKQTMSPREIVELLMVIGNYMMIARVMATTGMELDDPVGIEALSRGA